MVIDNTKLKLIGLLIKISINGMSLTSSISILETNFNPTVIIKAKIDATKIVIATFLIHLASLNLR